MAATTISRTWYDTLVDDDGSGTTGSVIDKADFDALLDAVDGLYSSVFGITLNQGAGDTAIFSAESSDVAHGMTSLAGTSLYGFLAKQDAAAGGLDVTGFSENAIGARLRGVGTGDVTTKTTSSTGTVIIDASKANGTTHQALQANGNLLVVRDGFGPTTRFIFDVEGDLHSDSSNTTFDGYQDALLVRALDLARGGASLIRSQFDAAVRYGRAELEAAGIATFNEDGTVFINWMQLARLQSGAIWQAHVRAERLEQRLQALEARLALTEG